MTKPIVLQLLEEIDRNVVLLERLREIPEESFVANPEKFLLAERCFQLAIQSMIDIAFYFASQNGWPRPETSADALLLLAQHEVLTLEFATKIQGMANFRNILVHAYLKINRRTVYRFLEDLDDFREFSRQIFGYLED